jgi:ssDNA-binding Zn-finger/Zn-ribbon topoisomerase 1
MRTIFEKYGEKAGIDDLNKVYFFYSGNLINLNNTLEDIISLNDRQLNKLKILVNDILESNLNNEANKYFEKAKNIICPVCGEISLININDYKIKILGCKNGHEINDLIFNQYENTQKKDISKIVCDICRKNNKANSYNNTFYRCFDCKNNICVMCKLYHDKKHNHLK